MIEITLSTQREGRPARASINEARIPRIGGSSSLTPKLVEQFQKGDDVFLVLVCEIEKPSADDVEEEGVVGFQKS